MDHAFGIQGYAAPPAWNVPFTPLPGLGGQFRMRGYFDGRFRDQNALISQVEYRFPIVWRCGGVGFASAGECPTGAVFSTVAGASGGPRKGRPAGRRGAPRNTCFSRRQRPATPAGRTIEPDGLPLPPLEPWIGGEASSR